MSGIHSEETGKGLVAVDTRFPSSKICSACGYVLEKLKVFTRSDSRKACQEHLRPGTSGHVRRNRKPRPSGRGAVTYLPSRAVEEKRYFRVR